MADLDMVIKGGTVATSGGAVTCDVGIRDGRVAVLAGDVAAGGAEVIDARGKIVMPGGIDSHCHIAQVSSNGLETADDFESGTRSAAAGGTTCIIPFAAQRRGESLRDVVQAYHARADGKAIIDYAFHLILADPTEQVLGQELPALIEDGYTSFKIYLTYDELKLDDREVLAVLATARRHGAMVMVHAENHDVIGWLTDQLLAAAKSAPRYHAVAHAARAESEATHRAIALSEIVGVPVLIVHVYRHRPPEPPLRLHVDPAAGLEDVRVGVDIGQGPRRWDLGIPHQGGNKGPVGGVHLKPVVPPVGNVDIAFRVHCHASRPMEVADFWAGGLELDQHLPIWGEFLDSVVLPVCDVHVVFPVDTDAPGHIKLSVAGARAAPLAQELAVFCKFLYAVIKAVHHEKVVIGVEGYARRPVQLTVAAAGLAPVAEERALAIKDGYTVKVIIGRVHILVSVQVEGARPNKLPISGPAAPELAQKLVVQGDSANALANLFNSPVKDVDSAVGPKCEILRRPEPLPGHRVHTDAVAVIEHTPCSYGGLHGSPPKSSKAISGQQSA